MYKSEEKVRNFAFYRKVFFVGVMDIPLYNALNLGLNKILINLRNIIGKGPEN
jgi:hypothetical protein